MEMQLSNQSSVSNYCDSTVESSIDVLSNDLLSKIFLKLEPKTRLLLSEVCRRWADVARMAWVDITTLDLSSIPEENIGPIIRLCPRLDSIWAHNCEFQLRSITANIRSPVRSLVFYDVCLFIKPPTFALESNTFDPLTHLEEAIWHKITFKGLRRDGDLADLDVLPRCLKRLQLTRGHFSYGEGKQFLTSLARFSDCMEALILRGPAFPEADFTALGRFLRLRELCINPFWSTYASGIAKFFQIQFPALEFLTLYFHQSEPFEPILPLLMSHPSLRILVLVGDPQVQGQEAIIPKRKLYPNGFDSDPVPLLHVFVGGRISAKVRFTRSDAMVPHPITKPMPEFLEIPEIAKIFEGMWIAEMIKRNAKLDFEESGD